MDNLKKMELLKQILKKKERKKKKINNNKLLKPIFKNRYLNLIQNC